MFKYLIEAVPGSGAFAIISMLIFFIFFSVIVIWTLRRDKAYLLRMKQLPLDLSGKEGDPNNV